jgi:E3 ubiquitin-protein ligase NEDD4
MQGFYKVINKEALKIFEVNELEDLLFGIQEIDVEDWKKNTFYKGEYSGKGHSH